VWRWRDLDAVFQRIEATSPDDPEAQAVMREIQDGVEMVEITYKIPEAIGALSGSGGALRIV
jgi:hypothetical protein